MIYSRTQGEWFRPKAKVFSATFNPRRKTARARSETSVDGASSRNQKSHSLAEPTRIGPEMSLMRLNPQLRSVLVKANRDNGRRRCKSQ